MLDKSPLSGPGRVSLPSWYMISQEGISDVDLCAGEGVLFCLCPWDVTESVLGAGVHRHEY